MKVGLGILSDASAGMSVGPIDTALGLDALGVDVTIFAEPAVDLPGRACHLADRVVRLAPAAVELPPRAADALFLTAKLSLARRWRRALEAHSVDVVHAFSPGTAAFLPERVPVVIQSWFQPARATLARRLAPESAYGTGGVGSSLPPRIRPAVQLAAHMARQTQTHASDLLGYRRAALLLAATPSAASFLERQGHGAECVPPCIAVAGAPAPRAPGDVLRLAFCAHPLDRPWKGLQYLLEALARRPEHERPVQLTLVGGWAERPAALLETVERAGVEVEVLGRVSREALLERLATRADVLVAPHLWEEWGYSVFEGLSRGVPVIAFDVYPYRETIGPELGSLVPARDSGALGRAISAAAAGDLPARECVLETTRSRFGAVAVAERLLDAYERARRVRRSVT